MRPQADRAGARPRSPSHRTTERSAVEQHQARDADLGDLLDEPVEAVALRRGDGDGDLGRAGLSDRRRRTAPTPPPTHRHARQRPAPSVTVTTAPSRRRSTRPRWWAVGVVEDGRGDVGDEHVAGRATQGLVHRDDLRERRLDPREQALLRRVAPPRRASSASWRSSACSSSSSLVGTSTTSCARRSPRPRPCSRGTPRLRSVNSLPGWVPAGHDELLVAVERRAARTVVPRAAWAIEIGTVVTRSLPSRQ